MRRLLIVTALVCSVVGISGARFAHPELVTQTGAAAQDAARSAQLDALMGTLIRVDAPGAAVMVIQDGRIVHARGYGLARLDTKEPVTLKTAFDLASTSKQFTAMAVMMLAERGKLGYDDPLTKFFPEFPAYAGKVTIRHLLTHTSGLADVLNPEWYRQGYEPPAKEVRRMMAREQNFRFAPGEKFEYNNTGYVLLALVVEQVSGQSFARFMRENLFKPLGMTDTLILDESKRKTRRMAVSYFSEGNQFKPYEPTSDIFFYGAKGVVSTLEDMRRWEEALTSEKLVKAATLKQAFTPAKLLNGTETIYGFGWFVFKENGVEVYEHAGGYLAYRANIRRYPALATTIILLSNNALIEPTPLARKIAQIYLGDRMKAAPEAKVDTASFKDYVGRYEADPKFAPGMMIDITLEDGELYITSPIKPRTKLIAQSSTEFQIAETASSVIFNRDDKGTVASLTLKTRRAVFDAKKLSGNR